MSKWFEPIVKKGFWPTCNGCWNPLKKTNEQAIAKKKWFFFYTCYRGIDGRIKSKINLQINKKSSYLYGIFYKKISVIFKVKSSVKIHQGQLYTLQKLLNMSCKKQILEFNELLYQKKLKGREALALLFFELPLLLQNRKSAFLVHSIFGTPRTI